MGFKTKFICILGFLLYLALGCFLGKHLSIFYQADPVIRDTFILLNVTFLFFFYIVGFIGLPFFIYSLFKSLNKTVDEEKEDKSPYR